MSEKTGKRLDSLENRADIIEAMLVRLIQMIGDRKIPKSLAAVVKKALKEAKG